MKYIAATVIATATTFGRSAAASSTTKSGKTGSCHRPTGSITFELEPLCFVEGCTVGALEVCSPGADLSESMPWYKWQAKGSNDNGCVDTKFGPSCIYNTFIIQCNTMKNLVWNTEAGALSSFDMCTAATSNFIYEADIGYPTLNIASSDRVFLRSRWNWNYCLLFRRGNYRLLRGKPNQRSKLCGALQGGTELNHRIYDFLSI